MDVSVVELSEKVNLTQRRCQQLSRAGIFVKTAPGKYDLEQSLLGYISFLQSKSGDAAITLTLNDIAGCTNRSKGNVIHLEKLGIFKKVSYGRYDFIESMRNFVIYLESKKRAGR